VIVATLSWDTSEGRKEHRLGARTQIGRSPEMDICVPDLGVSACHARIVYEGQAWILEDAGSTNGTFVNDEQQRRCELHDGDVVRVGNVAMTFRATEPTATSTLVWSRGLSDAPVPVDAEGSFGVERDATSLDEFYREGPRYSPVSAVDSTRFSSSAQPRDDEDPGQLARRLRASYEISRATAATLDPSQILDRVLTALFEIFDRAERAFIVLVDPQTHEVNTAAVKRRVAHEGGEAAISRTALEQAMRDREALLCRDAAADERFAKAQSIMSLGIRSMMIAPLLFRDEVLGAVHIDSVTGIREFTQADLELLSMAASQVAGCLANARLHEKVVATERLAAVGQTVAGLTHCVKNILQGIKGGAYILDKGLEQGDADRVRTGWGMVRDNNAFMEELVSDLLTYSKQREPDYAPADLNDLCGGVCALVAERAESKDVPLSFELDESLGVVEIDPMGIRRCVLNLVANAVDACEEGGGAVTVQTRAPGEDGLVRVIIRDTGSGMSQETLAKLFTVFFSTKGSKGTGLGLAVTRKIVEEHGGRIDVESQEGEGTTFTICLPPNRAGTAQEGA
jgi:signal transduction histidine kinase